MGILFFYFFSPEIILHYFSSTAIFEGISFQLPTFILKNPEEFSGIEKTLKKFKQGIYFVNNEEDVKSILENKLVKPNKSDIEMLWESNCRQTKNINE